MVWITNASFEIQIVQIILFFTARYFVKRIEISYFKGDITKQQSIKRKYYKNIFL